MQNEINEKVTGPAKVYKTCLSKKEISKSTKIGFAMIHI